MKKNKTEPIAIGYEYSRKTFWVGNGNLVSDVYTPGAQWLSVEERNKPLFSIVALPAGSPSKKQTLLRAISNLGGISDDRYGIIYMPTSEDINPLRFSGDPSTVYFTKKR